MMWKLPAVSRRSRRFFFAGAPRAVSPFAGRLQAMVGWARQTLAAHPGRAVGVLVMLLGLLGFIPAIAYSDGPAKDGMFLSVPGNITDSAVSQLENQVRDAFQRQNRRLSVIVFDFNPNGQPSGAGNFHVCHQLAE